MNFVTQFLQLLVQLEVTRLSGVARSADRDQLALRFVQLLSCLASEICILLPTADRIISFARKGFQLPLKLQQLSLGGLGTMDSLVPFAQDGGDFDELLTDFAQLRLGFCQARGKIVAFLLRRRSSRTCFARSVLQIVDKSSNLLVMIYIIHRMARTGGRSAGVSLRSKVEIGIVWIRLRHNAGSMPQTRTGPRELRLLVRAVDVPGL